MITTRPSPFTPPSSSGVSPSCPTGTPAAGEAVAWQLLCAGDEVSIAGQGRYSLIYLSEGSAWLEGCADGANRLVPADGLRLVRGGRVGRPQ